MKRFFSFILAYLVGFSVYAQAPTWNVNAADYQYTSTLTGVLIINDSIINSSNNILGAFVDGDVRGVATSTNVGNTKMYFITLYSNIASGEYITFKAYIDDQDSIHNVIDSIQFASSATFGTPENPFQLDLNNNQPPHFTNFNSYSVQEDESFSVINLLDFTSNTGNYALEYTVVNSANLTGGIVNNNLFVFHNGAIGVDSVLVAMVDSNDVSIVYDEQYMVFEVKEINEPIYFLSVDDFKWGNNSNPCIDLSEYLVNTNNDSIIYEVITYPTNLIGNTTVSWSVTPSDYQYSMNMAVEVNINGLKIEDGDYQLGAFNGSNLVGVVSPQFVQGKWMCFLTVYSNSTSGTIKFQLWDSNDNVLYDEQTQPINFAVDGIVGSISTPEQLYFGTHSYSLYDDLLCISLFDSIPGEIDSFIVVATEALTNEKFTDTLSFTVSYFDENQPFLNGIQNQTILVGDNFISFDLDDYLTEIDSDNIIYSVIGSDSVHVSIDINNIVSLTPNSSTWQGVDTIIFRATDDNSNGLYDVDTVIYSVVPGISLNGIEDQTINPLQTFRAVALNDYLQHYYAEPVEYKAVSKELINVITNDTLRTYLPYGSWLGTDTIIVTVQNLIQPQLFDKDTFIYTVENAVGLNLPIEIINIDDQILFPESNTCIDFIDNLVNVDNDSIIWSLFQASSSNFTATINEFGVMCISVTSGTDFIDSVLVKAKEFGTFEMYEDSGWQTIYYSSDHTPIISGVQNQSIIQGESFTSFDLDNYVTEIDGDSLLFLVQDTNNINIEIDVNNVVTILPKDELWYGSDTVLFIVTDSTLNQLSDSIYVVYTIKPKLDVFGILDQTINYSESFLAVDLLDHINYPYIDSVQWIVLSNNLIGTVNNNVMNVYFPSSNWTGTDTLYIKAMNYNDNSVYDIDTAIYIVLNPSGIVSDLKNENKVYPNPSSGSLIVEGSHIQKIEVYNILGELVSVETINKVDRVNLLLKKGIYLLKVYNINGEVSEEKVIIH